MQPTETMHILLLEDDPDDHRLITRHLGSEQCKFVVDWAPTLASAVEKLGEQSYDVIITDLHVPDSAGLETVTSLRRACTWTPIIILTSLDDDYVESNLMEVNAQDYLVKGEFGGRAIARAILHVVKRHQATCEITDLVAKQQKNQQQLKQQALLLKEKNRRLEKLYKTAHEFVDNVSHDFRTPLTVIKDYASIIREGMVGSINEEQQGMLDKVSVRVDDLNIMVDDLLDVSKLESGLLGAWRRNCRIENVVQRTLSMLEQRAQVRQVELRLDIEDDLPEVYCDADKVARVITNLAVNAIKFAGAQGQVRLWVEADPAGNQVIVGVTDDGPGIDESCLQQIFRRFEQIDEMQTPVKGFGLGLNIAQQLCRLNLGELGVQSQVGKGSTFSFTLPTVNPVEVVRRWSKVGKTGVDLLQVIQVTADRQSSEAELGELDKFLSCLLHRNDLLFHVRPGCWLIALAVPAEESQEWFSRAEKEFQKMNRNRPAGALPDYQAKLRCQWDAQVTHEEIVTGFASLLEESEEAENQEDYCVEAIR
jgi:signal transduction histidine kinase